MAAPASDLGDAGPDATSAAIEERFFATLRSLWSPPPDHPLATLLPRDRKAVETTRDRMRGFLGRAPREASGIVDPGATIHGEIVHLGPGAVIEAGVIVQESCRLYLGAGSRIRSGAILRDEVVVGPGCLIGAVSEVARSILLGPETVLGHQVLAFDSIVGAQALASAYIGFANTMLGGGPVHTRFAGASIGFARTHLGSWIGDRVRLGASIVVCPGTMVLPGLALPPGCVLLGTIDAAKRDRLMANFLARWGDGPETV